MRSNTQTDGFANKAWWLGGSLALISALAVGCGDDDAADDPAENCDGGECAGADGTSGSGGASGSSSGGTGGTNSGEAGSSGANAGSSGGEPVGDAAVPAPDASIDEPPGGDPASDGSQLAACAEDGDCTEDRVCYTPGAQQATGYCTAACQDTDDCAALGAEYTCSAGGGGGGGQDGVCRLECEGEDDTSCPELMSCVETSQGNFRCAYVEDEGAPGEQNVALWEACGDSGECMEGLVCYGVFAGGGGPGGGGVQGQGYCTQPCENDDECTEEAPSGDIAPTCGTTGGCRFDCSEGGECPDGMECVSQGGSGGPGGGGGTERCMFPEP